MAFLLSELIISGELYHTPPYSVHGILLLRGCEDPIMVDLTGAPAEDLQGRGYEFRVPANDRPPTEEDRRNAKAFKNQQVGPTGEMTAAGKVKVYDCSPEEFRRLSELGQRPPLRLEQRLSLEWFSQNGRVLIELTAPEFRFLEFTPRKYDLEAIKAEVDKRFAEAEAAAELEGGETSIEEEVDALELESEESKEPGEEAEDGYQLIPDELSRELERASRRVDREMSGESEETIRSLEEWELMDEVIEHGEGSPITEVCVALPLPEPDTITTEEAADKALKTALAELALYGVAFHVCEHFSLREAYRVFADRVCKKHPVYPQMRGTGWVQHFTTSDYCKDCMGGEVDPD